MPAVKKTPKKISSKAAAASTRAGAPREDAGITREKILLKYWELANLDPEATKGNIAGQLKALDSLREELGPAAENAVPRSAAGSGPSAVYRAAWMPPTGDEPSA